VKAGTIIGVYGYPRRKQRGFFMDHHFFFAASGGEIRFAENDWIPAFAGMTEG
jgi:hypothetical protein